MIRKKTHLQSMLEESRTAFRHHLLVETAEMANSWVPEYRAVARRILGTNDFVKMDVQLDRDTMKKVRSLKKVIGGNNKLTDAYAREVVKDKEVESDNMKKIAAKLVSVGSAVLIRRHIKNPRTGPKEQELVEALESLDEKLVAPMHEELKQLARKSPYESVKRAAMAILERI
jgi:hypothetical protein